MRAHCQLLYNLYLYYSTFMIDIQYFNSLIVIFFTFIALVFTRKSTEAKKWSPHYSKLHRVNTLALFLVIFHQSLHSQATQSFFRELLVMRYGVLQESRTRPLSAAESYASFRSLIKKSMKNPGQDSPLTIRGRKPVIRRSAPLLLPRPP